MQQLKKERCTSLIFQLGRFLKIIEMKINLNNYVTRENY